MIASVVTLLESDGVLQAKTPFDWSYVKGAKRLGGKWDLVSRTWNFDPRVRSRLEALCRLVYGTAGEDVSVVTVRIRCGPHGEWPKCCSMHGPQLFAFGACRAGRPGMDYSVLLGSNTTLIEGDFPPSGGSSKYPSLAAPEGLTIEVMDVPAVLCKDLTREEQPGPSAWIVFEPSTLESLQDEKSRLLARIQEIDSILEVVRDRG